MCGTGFIITKVRLMHCRRESFPEERAQRDHVRLLDHFGLLRPVAPEHHIDGRRQGAVRLEFDLLQLKEPGKLLEQIGRPVESGGHELRGPTPGIRFIGLDLQALAYDRPDIGTARAEPVDRIRGPLQVPLRHDIGIRIVIHGFMVFIRPDDRSNVILPVRL